MAALLDVGTLQGHEERVWCVTWRPSDPPQLTSCGEDRIIRIWGPQGPIETADQWRLIAEVDTSELHDRSLRSLEWNSTGDVLAVAAFDKKATLWIQRERISGSDDYLECVGSIEGHENEVKSLGFSKSGKFFATCSRDKSVWIYETDPSHEYECVATLHSHTQDVKLVRWHPTHDILFSCSYDDTIKIWGPDGDDWSCMHTLAEHSNTVWAMSFSPDGDYFASSSADQTVKIWAQERPKESIKGVSSAWFVFAPFRRAATAKPIQDPTAPWNAIMTIADVHERPIYAVDWLPFSIEGNWALATACGDNKLRIFTASTASPSSWKCAVEKEVSEVDLNSVAWLPCRSGGQQLLASADDLGVIKIWRFCSDWAVGPHN